MTAGVLEEKLSDWAPPHRGRKGNGAVVAEAAVPALALALLTFDVRPLYVVLDVLFILVVRLIWIARRGPALLARFGAVQVSAEAEPRFHNLAAGVAGSLGMVPPELRVIPEGGPNALVCSRRGRVVLALTRSLLDTYARTELEAVITDCLVRVGLWGTFRSSCAATWGSARLGPRIGTDDDLATVAITRYPPGLWKALEKTEPRSGSSAPFWWVADWPSHRPKADRIAELRDL